MVSSDQSPFNDQSSNPGDFQIKKKISNIHRVTNLTFEPLAVNQVIKGFRSSTILANQKFQILANQKFQSWLSTQQVTYRGVT